MNQRKISFSNNLETDFVVALRSRVKKYFEERNITRFGNANMVIKTIFMFALLLVPYLLIITGVFEATWLIILSYVLMGFGTAGIGLCIMHDANHRSYSKHQWVNNLLSRSLNLVGGYQANWQYQHNVLHHGFTNIDGYDEDIDPGSYLRFSPNAPYKKIHRYQHIYAWFLYGLMTLTWTIDKDFKQAFRYFKEGVVLVKGRSKTFIIADLFITKILYYAYFFVLPIILLPIPWWSVILLYFLAHFIAGFSLAVIFQTAHVMPSSEYPKPDDQDHLENNWTIHQLQTTSNYATKNKIFSWLVGSLNFQVEHHLFPAICHIHYPKLSVIVKETAAEYNMPYHVQSSFGAAIKEHYKMLKQLGKT